MSKYPEAIENLITEFNKLPGIGRKSAERFVFYLLKQPPHELKNLGLAIENIKTEIKQCSVCQNFSKEDPCPICVSSARDKNIICIVAQPQDVLAIEKTSQYQGTYHVLHGTLNPPEGITPQKLKINELLKRVEKNNINEIILALNPDIEGESTSLHIKKLLSPFNLKITQLGRGLAMGSELEYADEITLSNALNDRKKV
ncbi:MAG: recombination mediator RecR [Patescibacteria group bacterium]|nr:recombination mediator RecR [Patescibacteria group bacterium]